MTRLKDAKLSELVERNARLLDDLVDVRAELAGAEEFIELAQAEIGGLEDELKASLVRITELETALEWMAGDSRLEKQIAQADTSTLRITLRVAGDKARAALNPKAEGEG